MGFLGDFFGKKGLNARIGAATGFVASGGNPLGGIAGGLAGFQSGGDTATSSTNTTGTSQMHLRDLTPEERALQTGAFGAVAANQGLTPEQANELRQSEFDRIFGSSSRAINTSFNLAQDRGFASDARRGLAGASASGARTDAREGLRQRNLQEASASAEGQALQAALLEQENRRATQASALAQLNSVWANRVRGSKVTTTGTGAGSQTGPDDFLQTALLGLGSAITNNNSSLNNGLLGGGTPTPTGPVPTYAGDRNSPAGPFFN